MSSTKLQTLMFILNSIGEEGERGEVLVKVLSTKEEDFVIANVEKNQVYKDYISTVNEEEISEGISEFTQNLKNFQQTEDRIMVGKEISWGDIIAVAGEFDEAYLEGELIELAPVEVVVTPATAIVNVFGGTEEVTFTAKVLPRAVDQDVVWSVEEYEGVSIDQEGVVTVLDTAEEGVVEITATCVEDEDIVGIAELTIEKSAPEPVIPETPTGLKVVGQTSSTITVEWNVVDGAETYNVRYREYENGLAGWVTSESISTNTYTIEDLSDNTAYEIQVSATNVKGSSDFSESVVGTTLEE